MRILRAPLASREEIERIDGVLSVDAHMYHPYSFGPNYPYLQTSIHELKKKVRILNSYFLGEEQRNIETLAIEIEHRWILLILRDKRKSNEYFNALEVIEDANI